MFDWLLARKVAPRLGLRDKGRAPYSAGYYSVSVTHDFCHTRIRIGITQAGANVSYCHRCECILEQDGGRGGPGKFSSIVNTDRPHSKELIPQSVKQFLDRFRLRSKSS